MHKEFSKKSNYGDSIRANDKGFFEMYPSWLKRFIEMNDNDFAIAFYAYARYHVFPMKG
ncbi:hypothetical protein KAH81_00750 [bacterium]|nr:hypothetical protein [bacterium]